MNDLNDLLFDDNIDEKTDQKVDIENMESSDDILDIQKELEAKFDELFGDTE